MGVILICNKDNDEEPDKEYLQILIDEKNGYKWTKKDSIVLWGSFGGIALFFIIFILLALILGE